MAANDNKIVRLAGLSRFLAKLEAKFAAISDVPTKTSDLTNDSGFIGAASPELTGTPTAPTAASGTDTTQIATCAFVQAAIDEALEAIANGSY